VHTVHTTSTPCTRHRLGMHWRTMFFLFQDPVGSRKAAASCFLLLEGATHSEDARLQLTFQMGSGAVSGAEQRIQLK
jgi:hypothetical protein